MFSANIHGLRKRIVRIFLGTFNPDRVPPLVTHYGALVGLCEMGQEVKIRFDFQIQNESFSIFSIQTIEELVLPRIRQLGDRVMKAQEGPSLSPVDKITIERINGVISVRKLNFDR